MDLGGQAGGQLHGPKDSQRPRLLVLDGLRLFAALAVLSWHLVSSPSAGWGHPLGPVGRFGWLGVELFFLISGFVICMSGWGRPVGDFAASRVARLYPAYWVAIAVSVPIVLLAGTRDLTGPQIAANLTMLQNPLGVKDVDPSYWTLGVELRFYLLFAIVLAIGITYRRMVYFCALWLAAAAFASGLPWLSWLISADNAPYFAGGTALYLIYRFGATPLLWALVTASWLLALYRVQSHMAATIHSDGGRDWVIAVVIVTAIYGVMAAVATGRLTAARLPVLTTAGALTYPLYLLHQSLGVAAIHAWGDDLPPGVLLGLLIPGLLGLAWLVHRYIERPVSAWLKRASKSSLAAMRRAS
ncbi:MAG: acyltransferase [Nonomuraea sp.]|nr:acyltransferase [Nonomuraea sp.]